MIRTGHFFEIGHGLRLHCALSGDASRPLMLMLHGFPEFWFAWRELIPHFSDQFFVAAPDLRGYNLSSAPPELEAYRIERLVADIDALLAGMGRERCVLVAHDWGGALAWSYAIARPQRVSRLIILNAPHPFLFAQALAADPEQQQASGYMNWLRRAGSEDILAQDEFRRLDGVFAGAAGSWFKAEVRAAYHQAWAQPERLRGAVNWYRATPLHPPEAGQPGAARLRLDEAQFRVEVPTLVIWGEQDTALLPRLLDGLDRFVSRLQIVRIAGASHWLIHEQPDSIAEFIRQFLNDTSQTGDLP